MTKILIDRAVVKQLVEALGAMKTNPNIGHIGWKAISALAAGRAALAQTDQPHDVLGKQEPLGADFAKVLHDNLDSLYEETEQSHGKISKVIGVGLEYRPDEHDRGYWKEEDGICLEYEDGYRDCFYISEIFATHKPAEPVNQVLLDALKPFEVLFKQAAALNPAPINFHCQIAMSDLRALIYAFDGIAQAQPTKREPLSDEKKFGMMCAHIGHGGLLLNDATKLIDAYYLGIKDCEASHGITEGQ